ncbi:MAG: CHC2 zinc finger domain-containing protein [Dehalococcoidia bacterium]|nr:CHC2 zinc finger domain-containing protein [Dehalococcoidia bacterium]
MIDIQDVKGRHRLEDVIEGEGILLRKEGANLVARCPFHSSPKFTIVVVILRLKMA